MFSLDQGCVCHPDDREQALCMQHVVRASPAGGMTLKEDLTVGRMFSKWWVGVTSTDGTTQPHSLPESLYGGQVMV